MIHEDIVVAAITKEGAAEFSNIRRCFHPARRFRIEISKFLQLSILFFRQKLNAHGSCHIYSAIFWLMLFACTLAHSRPLWRFMFFSKRAFNALSSSSRCSGDNSLLLLLMLFILLYYL